MAISSAPVRQAANGVANAQSVQATIAATTAGNCLVAAIAMATGSSTQVSTVTDSAGNTWQWVVSGFQTGANTRVEYWICPNAASVTTVTATKTGAVANMSINVSEWSGVDNSNPVHVSASLGTASSTAPNGAAVTTTIANTMVLTALSHAAQTSSLTGGGFTALTGITSNQRLSPAYRAGATAATYQAVYSISGGGSTSGSVTIALKPAAATSAGAATGTITWAGSAAGKKTPKGAATGTITWAGSAAGTAPAALTALVDTFTGSTIDTAKWTASAGVTQAGTITLPCTSSYPALNSVAKYSLVGSSLYVQLITRPAVGNGTTQAIMQLDLDGSNNLQLGLVGGSIYYGPRTAGVESMTYLTYDSAVHKWWRIREASGTVYFETSANGLAWSALGSIARPSWATAPLTARLVSGYYGTETSPGNAVFDNLNYTRILTRVGVAVPTGPNTTDLATFQTIAGGAVREAMWYVYWSDNGAFPSASCDAVLSSGRRAEITWEPWNGNTGGVSQPTYSLANITAGNFDTYITSWANAIKAWGKPLRIRFAHEMNGNWYPWAEGVNGNTTGQYATMWQHVVGIFQSVGVNNVTWVWSPNVQYSGSTALAGLYPGDAYVGNVGIDGYNWGTVSGHTWQTPSQLFDATITAIQAITSKPLVISETASTETGGDKAAWITQFFAWLHSHPEIGAFTWFNMNKETDWRIESTSAATTAFQQGMQGLADPGAEVFNAATGAITWAGSAAGKKTPKGAASGAITWAGSAAGKKVSKGAAAATVTWAGSAAGDQPPNRGAATGTITWAGSAAGKRAPKGAAAGTITWSATASGSRTPKGAATGTVTWSGAAAGKRAPKGGAAGAITWSGAAAGTRTPKGGATGTVTWSATAAGVQHPKAAASGSITWSGAAAGTAPPVGDAAGAASGSIVWAGSAAGVTSPRGSATGAISWSGTAAGVRAPRGQAAGTVTWTGAATGDAPDLGSASGSATGAIVWAGSAAGRRLSAGSAVGVVTWTGQASGVMHPQGGASGAIVWSGGAAGLGRDPYPLVRHPRLTVMGNRAALTVEPNGAALDVRPNTAKLEVR